MIKIFLKKLKRRVRFFLGIKNDTDYYSQGGEDAIILKTVLAILPDKKGFYMDIGAYHPYYHSNTYLLYKLGWRGINIDPQPGSKKLFDRNRPGDINIEAGVGSSNSNLNYYMIGEKSTMNTFSLENLQKLGIDNQVKQTISIPVYTFDTILQKYPDIKSIDYLNIDAEGYEMEIISKMTICKPRIISIEQNDIFFFDDVLNSQVCIELKKMGYRPIAKNIILKNVATVFYYLQE